MELDKLIELNSKASDLQKDIIELRSKLGMLDDDPILISYLNDLESSLENVVKSTSIEYLINLLQEV